MYISQCSTISCIVLSKKRAKLLSFEKLVNVLHLYVVKITLTTRAGRKLLRFTLNPQKLQINPCKITRI